MAPEQLRSSRDATPASDQYALGILFYECLTGGTPYWSDDYYELLRAIMTAELIPPSEINTNLPSGIDSVIERALRRDPAQRFPTVKEFGEAVWPFASADGRRRWGLEFGCARDGVGTFALSAGAAAPPSKPRAWLGAKAVRLAAVPLLAAAGVIGMSFAARRHAEDVASLHAVETKPSAATSADASELAVPSERPHSEPQTIAPVSSASAAPSVASIRAAPRAATSARAPAKEIPDASSSAPVPPAPVERGTYNIPIVE
jgi:serine/threonine-protein kinase